MPSYFQNMAFWLFVLLVLIIAGFFVYRSIAKRRRREQLLAAPLTAQQRRILAELVPIVRRLPAELHPKLEGKINLFRDQVTFHGKNDLEVNEAIELSIAAQACLLVVNSSAWYETLRTILVYPSAFYTRRGTHDGFVVNESEVTTLGESWARGPVVLSWDHALRGGLDDTDGHNVVIHEFAHQLDGLSGHTNGIPILRKGQAYAGWEKAMLDAYDRHVERLQVGETTLIDPYGATNHEEFLAEAIVTFFEKPRPLQREEPALYEELSQLLALDPAQW